MKKQLLIKIKQIVNQGLEGTSKTFENLDSYFILNNGASQEDIFNCDSYFVFKLPDDYKSFLKEFNGGILFKIEDFAGFKLLDCNSLIRENEFQKINFAEEWDERIILFCSSIGDGEYLGIKLLDDSNYEIVDCVLEELPSTWRSIGNSIDDFIERLIDEKGKKYWLNY